MPYKDPEKVRAAKRRYKEKIKALSWHGWPERTCAQCGTTFATRECQECSNRRNKEYRARHKDRLNEQMRLYYKTQRSKTVRKIYRLNNPDKYASWINATKQKNPQRWLLQKRLHAQKRRAIKAKVFGKVSSDVVDKLMRLQRNKCAYCRCNLLGAKYELDHVVPLARGGMRDDSNFQLLCRTCNREKSAHDPIAFAQRRGFLL
jgi:5-methylcytosine-specific restriction endonuclease McrA